MQTRIFGSVTPSSTGARWILSSDIRAFCCQTRGFIVRRVAGIAAIDFTLTHDGTVAWSGTIEHVVTDADAEYSGSFVSTVEQAMRHTMADALHLILRDAAHEIEHFWLVAVNGAVPHFKSSTFAKAKELRACTVHL